MPRQEFDVRVEGLADLRRGLRAVDRETLKEVQKALKGAAQIVAQEAASIAPRRTGRLAASYKPFTRGNVAGVRSSLPYAGVIEYGGDIAPRGTTIHIRRYEPVTRAIQVREQQILDRVESGIEEAIRRTGF